MCVLEVRDVIMKHVGLHFLDQDIWKPILCGRQTFVLGKFPPGAGYCVSP